MTENYRNFEQRKQDHIDIVLTKNTQTTQLSDLDRVHLPHEALPDFNFADINLSSTRFEQVVSSPFLVSSMTAGHKNSININEVLVKACSRQGWIMGVGSQRRELSDPNAANEWLSMKQNYPTVPLLANLGIAQLCHTKLDAIARLIDNIDARGIIIHLNALQECIQPEGTPQFKGSLNALEHLIKNVSLPVIVKETGCGFSMSTLQRLNDIGVNAVDVSGLGGTHWGRVESYRAPTLSCQQQAGETFKHWGISSVQSIINAKTINPNFEIWGSGGVRSGLDAAKLIALGATTIGLAKPLLKAALNGVDEVVKTMQTFEYELKVALFCTGNINLQQLQESFYANND